MEDIYLGAKILVGWYVLVIISFVVAFVVAVS